MISTVFFDLDGTLIDQKTAQNEACVSLYRRYGFDTVSSEQAFIQKWDELTEYHYDSYLQRACTYDEQRERRINDLFAAFGVSKTGKTAQEIYAEYLSCFEAGWRAYPEVIPCLEELKGYCLGVLTNGDADQQKKKLEATSLSPYFSYVICAGDYPYAKPDPRLFETVCQVAGVPLAECVYVGDSLSYDIVPCMKLGMKCVFINRKNQAVGDEVCAVPSFENLAATISQMDQQA